MYVQCESKKIIPRKFLKKKFLQQLRIFKQNFTCLLCVEIYGKLHNCIQSLNKYAILSATSSHGLSDAGLAEGQLYHLHRKG